jgi:dihydrofolate synthase/folylpolyglutamate synthase
LATAITNIGLEHTKYLGDTLAKIAFEKAGILKAGVPVVVGEHRREALDVILARAEVVGTPIHLLGREFSFRHDTDGFAYMGERLRLSGVHLALAGNYQGPNAAIAVALAESAVPRFDRLTPDAVCAGLETAHWPCRLETVLRDPEVIVDVAHNVAGAEVLAHALPDRCVIILAIANDKDATSIIRTLQPKAAYMLLTQFEGKRSLTASELSERASNVAHETLANIPDALERGIAIARDEGIPLVVAGSLFTAGEARQILIRDYGAPTLQF